MPFRVIVIRLVIIGVSNTIAACLSNLRLGISRCWGNQGRQSHCDTEINMEIDTEIDMEIDTEIDMEIDTEIDMCSNYPQGQVNKSRVKRKVIRRWARVKFTNPVLSGVYPWWHTISGTIIRYNIFPRMLLFRSLLLYATPSPAKHSECCDYIQWNFHFSSWNDVVQDENINYSKHTTPVLHYRRLKEIIYNSVF